MYKTFSPDEDSESGFIAPAMIPVFAYAFKEALIGMAVVNQQGDILEVNEVLCGMLGYTRRELLGMNKDDIVCAAVGTGDWMSRWKELAATKKLRMEKRFRHKDGHWVWAMLNVSLLPGTGGSFVYYAQLQDLTSRKAMEEKLERSRQELGPLFEYNPDIVCIVDMKGHIVSINSTMRQVTGYETGELAGRHCKRFIFPGDLVAAAELFEAAKSGRTRTGEFNVSRKDGSWITVEVNTLPIQVGSHVEGIYAIAKDVTRRRETEERLRTSEKLSAVGQLAAGVAHEIRNPLTALKGFTQFLQSGAEGKQEYYEIMMSELNRIDLILSELLMLAKPKASEFAWLNPELVIRHVLALLEAQAILKNVQFLTNVDGSLSGMMGAENQLKQLFVNLLKNAIEAMPDGGLITIRLQEQVDKRICFAIADQGSGIPQDLIDKIGVPFYTTKDQGSGLGMMVSRKIVEEHKGTLQIESVIGEGTIVYVRLPINRESGEMEEKRK
ncbi:PAS domain-containing sensor histidine kinase [Paenibacillus chitinolyticus]|uniref:PAS domain-containing sensor histidine kinase n=1 Tax=Paenibacillus chitinolyticus TaxID=79263 RepID=UPI00366C7BB5